MISIDIKKEKLVKQLLFFNLMAFGVTLLALFVAIFALKDVVMPYIEIMFSDFYDVMKFALSPNPYHESVESSYPPLAILILYPFAFICRGVIRLDDPTYNKIGIIQTPQFWLSFLLFFTIFFVAAALLIKKNIPLKGKSLVFFMLAVFTSGTVLYSVSRGNVLISAFVFLLVFMTYYKSENKILRELALVSLALAGVIKIYPLFFGVFLLKDKKFFAAARVAAYTLILFFVPFLCFDGGFSNIKLFIANLGSFSSGANRLLLPLNMSATGLVHKLFYLFELAFKVSLSKVSSVISLVLNISLGAVAIIGVFFSKTKLSALFICCAIVVLVPPISYYYSMIFLLIPMIEFVKEYENLERTRKRLYFILFVSITFLAAFLACFIFGIFFVGILLYESIKNIKNHINFSKEKQKKSLTSGGTT